MVSVDFIDSDTHRFNESLKSIITRAFKNSLEMEGISTPVEVCVQYITPERIRELNKEYRGIDKGTDVLSFPIYADKSEIPESDSEAPVLLGDVLINPIQTAEQAVEYGNSFEREVLYLAIHSFLHLLGYDHMEDEPKRKMRSREIRVLDSLALVATDGQE